MTTKYQNGAFVFWTMRGVAPAFPVDVRDHARALNLDPDLVPAYAGDRRAVSRAITACTARLHRQGWLLRPIKTKDDHLVYGLVKETKDTTPYNESLKHDFTTRVWWKADNPDEVRTSSPGYGEYEPGQLIESEYMALRGKIVADDWRDAIRDYLVRECQATAMRDDGRIYWLPPQNVDKARVFSELLAAQGINLIFCEIEGGALPDVQVAAADSLAAELEQLQAEIAAFDGTQKPTTYTRRLELCTELKARAEAYHAALGIAVADCVTILDTLETRTQELLDVRKTTRVPRTKPAAQVEYAF